MDAIFGALFAVVQLPIFLVELVFNIISILANRRGRER